MKNKIHFFDAIDANKRNSNILIGFAYVLGLIFIWILLLNFLDPIISFVLAIFLSGAYIYFSYSFASSMVLNLSNAKILPKDKNPYIYNVVEGLAIASGIPIPKVYVINDPAPNAFATGINPKKSSIALTTGLIEKLNKRELTAVISHEISHIANFDVKYILVAIAVVGFIAVVANIFARIFLYSNNRRDGGMIFLVIGVIMLLIAPIISEIVRFAISRQREYLADANGSKLTRDPNALISALKKISKHKGSVKAATNVTAPLYFSDPLRGKFSGLFATHPPIEKRIERLGRL